jgi:hypothetical protein
LKVIEQRVKPERLSKAKDVAKAPWWQFWRVRKELYEAISKLEKVLTVAATSRTLAFAIVPSRIVFSHATYVFAMEPYSGLALLQSAFHDSWAREYASSMKGDLRYTPTDCLENFAFPVDVQSLRSSGTQYDKCRSSIMRDRREGLTKTYNRFHDCDETAKDIQKLRDLHVEMDQAVAAAYGWDDLDLGHGFHTTKQGERFTISEAARREVLQRLLKLNHQRYAEEVKQGLHKKGKAKKPGSGKGTKKPIASGPALFGDDDDEEG